MEKTYEVWGIHEAVELVEAADKLGLKVMLTKGATFDYATMKGETYSHNSPSGYRVTVYWEEEEQADNKTTFSKAELNLIREWHNAVKDYNPIYLEDKDHKLYKKVLSNLPEWEEGS